MVKVQHETLGELWENTGKDPTFRQIPTVHRDSEFEHLGFKETQKHNVWIFFLLLPLHQLPETRSK